MYPRETCTVLCEPLEGGGRQHTCCRSSYQARAKQVSRETNWIALAVWKPNRSSQPDQHLQLLLKHAMQSSPSSVLHCQEVGNKLVPCCTFLRCVLLLTNHLNQKFRGNSCWLHNSLLQLKTSPLGEREKRCEQPRTRGTSKSGSVKPLPLPVTQPEKIPDVCSEGPNLPPHVTLIKPPLINMQQIDWDIF